VTHNSFTAKGAKAAKEQKSLTAKDTKDAKENKGFTAKDAKETVFRIEPQGRQDNAKSGIRQAPLVILHPSSLIPHPLTNGRPRICPGRGLARYLIRRSPLQPS
jgi:hypothetical protein